MAEWRGRKTQRNVPEEEPGIGEGWIKGSRIVKSLGDRKTNGAGADPSVASCS